MAQSTFAEDSKLGPLLGLSPDRSNVIEATQMTEIYEFAMSLADTHFNLGSSFLHAKFEYVKSLINFGFTFQGFSYCEVIAKQLGSLGSKDESLRWGLLQVGERLKNVDLSNNSDWIQDLRNALTDAQTTDNSESSSRRGSYPPSGISSVDPGGSQVTGPDGALIQDPVVENGYQPVSNIPMFNPNQVGNEGYGQPEQVSNQNAGAYESHQSQLMPTNPLVWICLTYLTYLRKLYNFPRLVLFRINFTRFIVISMCIFCLLFLVISQSVSNKDRIRTKSSSTAFLEHPCSGESRSRKLGYWWNVILPESATSTTA